MTLSILICTVEYRKPFFNRLMALLKPMIEGFDDVEIVYKSDFALMSIGEKRNYLVNDAKGEYSVFIDDDDLVDSQYLKYVMPILREGKVDGVGFKGLIYHNNRLDREFIHKHGQEFVNPDDKTPYLRPLNHLNPVRTSIMKQISFLNISHGEDTNYATRLAESGLIKETAFIDRCLYFYYHRSQKTELPRKARR